MATRAFLVTLLLLFCFLQVLSDFEIDLDDEIPHVAQEMGGGNRRLMLGVGSYRGEGCGRRCSQHSRPNLCIRACSTCCMRCRCVPPGTYGNREMCGKCYTDMTTHGNKTKCP